MSDDIIVWLVLCGIGVGTLVVIIWASWASVAIGELALDYSALFKSVDRRIYSPGYYYIGLTHAFKRFPYTLQTIEFSLDPKSHNRPIRSRTSDGLEVMLEISFQYRFMAEKLYDMYMTYGENSERVFGIVAVDVLTDLTTKYNASQFFYDRGTIGDNMKKELGQTYRSMCFSTVEFFQLRTVDLPDPFEESIQDTEVKKQDIEKAKAERQNILIEWETKVKEAQIQKEVLINRAEAEAIAIVQQNEADIQNINFTQALQAEAYFQLKQQLNLTPVMLLDYIKAKLIKQYQHPSNIFITMDKLQG
jgi:regulator of protease activity HflC (stomatin/prohibitin superfamily)